MNESYNNMNIEFVPPTDMNVFVRLHCKVLRRFHIYFIGLVFVPQIQSHWATALMISLWGGLDLIRFVYNLIHLSV